MFAIRAFQRDYDLKTQLFLDISSLMFGRQMIKLLSLWLWVNGEYNDIGTRVFKILNNSKNVWYIYIEIRKSQ